MKRRLILLILAGVTLLSMMLSVHPATNRSFILVVPFVLIYVATYQAAMIGTQLVKGTAASVLRRVYKAHAAAAGVVMCLALQSTGQLTLRDSVTLLLLLLLAYFYLSRTASK